MAGPSAALELRDVVPHLVVPTQLALGYEHPQDGRTEHLGVEGNPEQDVGIQWCLGGHGIDAVGFNLPPGPPLTTATAMPGTANTWRVRANPASTLASSSGAVTGGAV